jgi:hypothetical protein
MVLKSSFYNNTANIYSWASQQYNADYYGAASSSSLWYVARPATGDQLRPGASSHPSFNLGGNIITLNATTLVVQDWLPGQIANMNKCFYHK